MRFENGHKRAEGAGRQKGSVTANAEIRGNLRDWTIENFEKFVAAASAIDDPERFVNVYLAVLDRVLPKLAPVKDGESAAHHATEWLRNLCGYKEND